MIKNDIVSNGKASYGNFTLDDIFTLQEQMREGEKTRRDMIRRKEKRQDMGDNAKLHAMLSCHVSQKVLTKLYGPAVCYLTS